MNLLEEYMTQQAKRAQIQERLVGVEYTLATVEARLRMLSYEMAMSVTCPKCDAAAQDPCSGPEPRREGAVSRLHHERFEASGITPDSTSMVDPPIEVDPPKQPWI